MAQNEIQELEEALAGFFSGLAEFQIEAGQISNAAAGVRPCGSHPLRLEGFWSHLPTTASS